MAQQVLVSITDDIDGSEAEGTVSFSLDGGHYEIDLSKANNDKLHAALEKYIEVARKVVSSKTAAPARGSSRRSRGKRDDGTTTEEIRAWAKQRGYKINDRGRIPESIAADFKANRNGVRNGSAPAAPQAPAAAAEPKADPEPATVKSGPAAKRGGRKPAAAKAAEGDGQAAARPRRSKAGVASTPS